MRNQLVWRVISFVPLLYLCLLASASFGADKAILTVGHSGAYLYAQQDEDSVPAAKLAAGEILTPLAEAVGPQTWYMVRTQQGLIGWVRRGDMTTAEAPEVFKEQTPPTVLSVWSARTATGRTFEGTWTIDVASSENAVSGTWTLADPAGQAALRGIWSAEKFTTGWRGVWRAQINGKRSEYGGTWTAEFAAPIDGRLSELFEAAGTAMIRGVWTTGPHSGGWVIGKVTAPVREDPLPYSSAPATPVD